MLSGDCLLELQTTWLPNMTDNGLDRIIELLERASPLLIHGCFTRSIPMGCLASHVAWNHPETAHLNQDAGIMWLHHVAGLNPATSHVLREWDRGGVRDLSVREELLDVFHQEKERRKQMPAPTREPSLVESC
jgi:hypothetical protein